MKFVYNISSSKIVLLGPVTITNSQGKVKLVGINTGTVGITANPNQYNIFTAVLPHKKWITNIIKTGINILP